MKLVSKATDKIGWDFAPHENFLTNQLRPLLLTAAGLAGHEQTVTEAKRQFTAFIKDGDKKAVHPSLRRTVFSIAVKNGGHSEYDALKKEYSNTTSVDGTEIILASLGRLQTSELAKDYLKWTFSGPVAMQDVHTPASALSSNSKVRKDVWTFVQENWQMLEEKLGGNKIMLERYLRMSLSKFASHQTEKEIADFFKDKDQSGFDRGLGIVSDNIKANARYRESDVEVIREWLQAHGYIQ